MTLSGEQQRQILARLDECWPKPRVCPICRGEAWRMQPRVFVHLMHGGFTTQPLAGTASFTLQQEALPTLLFNCGVCGYVATFLASCFGVDV